jgi:plastocyanin
MQLYFGMILVGIMLVLGGCSEKEQSDEHDTMNEEGKEEVEVEETDTSVEEEVEEPKVELTEAKSGEASPLLKKGESTAFVFNEAGEYSIYCQPHPVMKMKVVVEGGAEQSGEVSIDIQDYAFSEETITVALGTVITWTNQDSAQHNVAFE